MQAAEVSAKDASEASNPGEHISIFPCITEVANGMWELEHAVGDVRLDSPGGAMPTLTSYMASPAPAAVCSR